MTITFISTTQALVWALAAIVALSLYMWKVRPYLAERPEFHEFYELADARWARLWAWIKIRWDMALAALLMASPSLWNGLLDLIIWLGMVLGDVLPVLATLDLSDMLLPKWFEIGIRIGAAFVPLARARYLGKDDE